MLASSDDRVRGIRFSRNFGKEAAIRAGLENAEGDAVAVIDCDLQHPPQALTEMIAKWRSGAEVVIGKKSSRGKETRIYGFFAGIFNSMMSGATGFDMSDASDFMLLDRKAVEAILEYGESGSFFRALAQFVGFRTAEVRYEVAARKNGQGKWTFRKLLKYALNNLASFTTLPLYFSTVCGAVSAAAGVLLLILGAAGVSLGPFTPAISVLITLAGLILLCTGIVGFYLSKIYEETKHRPRYHIASTVNERKEHNDR